MDKELRDEMRVLALPATPTDVQMSELLAGWERYFNIFGVPPEKQKEEFDGIVRARVFSGSISLVPPE